MEDGEIEEGMVTADEIPTPEVTTTAETTQPPREPGKSPLELLRESKASVEEIVATMLSMKKEGNHKSEIRELLTQMFLNFVNLRQANRAILTEEDKVKAETERAKAPVDFTTLQLHNLMYEKSHYVKAIKACRDFKSKYPDIDLVPEQDFFRDAPEAIKDQSQSSDSSHVLMPKRLNFELHQRKELCKQRARLEQKKKSLLETIAERKKFLSSLPLHLKTLKKASLPVQNQLDIQHTKKLKQHNLAELLPPPLYVLYSQLLAQKEAFEESIDLEVVGSLKDAQAYARQQSKKKDSGMLNNTESSRLEDDGPDDDDDGQRRRKRPKKLTSKEGSDKTGLYQVHPLKIFLHIYDDEMPDAKSFKLVILKFEYLLKLNVVCVGAEGSQDGPEKNIFCNLFPDDAGLEPPHQSTKLILGDGQAFDENRTSRPYKWVQHLAGIDILPEVSPVLLGEEAHNTDSAKSDAFVPNLSLYRQQHRVQTVLQRIRSRKKAHLALAEQLGLLMKHELPVVNCEDAPWALHKVLCALDSWLHIRPSASKSCSLTLNSVEQVPEPMEIDVDGRSIPGKEDLESIREDGELPSLVTAAASLTSSNHTPLKVSSQARSRQLALMTKNLDSPVIKGKSPSSKIYEDDLDLVLDDDSEVDEPAGRTEAHVEALCPDNTWVDYGAREFALVLSRKTDGGKLWKLEATVYISMEYPLRPPLFSLSLHASSSSGNDNGTNESDHYNELRAMEAEVNLHMLKIIPSDQENYLLSHQIRCLAMLFDYYVDDPSLDSKRGTATTVVDVGLCKPVDGKLLVRSFRGRDHRKMISWKGRGCASGYPC
ncbi:PREDICTED: THO complex subunit 5B-like [Camelina sativa]|uniref:THO complex subunit 5B-like n=1 Tax=Camelina sativa TaxID=90675 RepID=A0ABM0Y205_CAMSA|nr:PREDICTED: THO complex subunit 5B-like [Camelina sativa]